MIAPPCRKCNGTGRVFVRRREKHVVVTEPCPRCHGTRADPDPLDPDDDDDEPPPQPETPPVSDPIRAITDRLAEPFDVRDVKFKPQMVKNNKALAIAYVDVRLIEDRLDAVLGPEKWQDDYDILPDGSVTCKLRVSLGGQWVTKMDVGSPSEQPDGGDRLKAAFSDALKRAAVKFGIGRYLYRLPAQWVEYDPAKKQIIRPPQLPAFANPRPKADEKQQPPKTAQSRRPDMPRLPANGEEFHRRLQDHDAKLAGEKRCARGALLAFITQAGVALGYPADLTQWTELGFTMASTRTKEFEALHPLPTKSK